MHAPPPRILKSFTFPDVEESASETPLSGPPLSRIPSWMVSALAPSAPPSPPPVRVIRGSNAQRLTTAFEPPVFEPEPAFALPDLEPFDAMPAPPEPPPLTADEVRIEMEAAFAAQLEEAVATARAEGYAEGQADAEAAHQEALAEAKAHFAADAEQLQKVWRGFIEDAHPMLAHLAFGIAESILIAPLPDETREVTARTLSSVLDQLAGEGPLRVKLHPIDLLRLQEAGLIEPLAANHPGLRWEADDALQPGEWEAQSPAGMIRRLEHELLDALRHRLGLSPLDDEDA